MPLGITELLTRIGDDNVRLQNLFDGDVDLTATKHGTRVSFYTDPANVTPGAVLHGTAMVALVLWLPKDAVDRALADYRAATPSTVGSGGTLAVPGDPLGASGPTGPTGDESA